MSFTVYRSSAGSGKTFTLVKEYLKIILSEPHDFRHILAITFTNKAAAEMKERVLSALREISSNAETGHGSALMAILATETGLTPPVLVKRASQVLAMILHNYSDFAIGTIDGFSHRIIRSFAHDFGLPAQFNVGLDSEELLTMAVDLLLEKAGNDEELTRFLVKFIEIRMDEDKSWNIDRILTNFASVLMDEEGQEHIVALRSLTLTDFSKITATLYTLISGFEKKIQLLGKEGAEMIRKSGISPDVFFQGEKGISKYFDYLASGKFDKMEPNSFVRKMVESDKWTSGKATPADIALVEQIKPALLLLYQKIIALLDGGRESFALQKLLTKTIFPLAVLNEIERILTELKKQKKLVHISEFNKRISSIVMREPVPFIYERLGEKYHHLMIDEFQDTSRLQWQNFVPLMENALASGYFNLVVGDGKQAIYRWRNGDVNQFSQLPALQDSDKNPLIKQREQALKNNFLEKNLQRNFRSKQEIVTFNNRFFGFLSDLLDDNGKRVYRDLRQEVDPEKTGGYIRIQFLDGKNRRNFEETNLGAVLLLIRALCEEGYALRDIAILCRKNDQASMIARRLMGEGIKVVSAESLLLKESPEVRFLISFLRLLYTAENPVTHAEIAGYLFQTKRLKESSWPETLKNCLPISGDGFFTWLNNQGWRLQKDDLLSLPLFDLCETLIRQFNLNTPVDPYLQFFLDSVFGFMNLDLANAGDFLDWWEAHKDKLSLVVPEALDAVKIMTVHKAKGLQFPVVIFPFATEAKRQTRDYLWVDLHEEEFPELRTSLVKVEKDLENTIFRDLYQEEDRKSLLDLINLLYVVMTRPEERLYVLTSGSQEKSVKAQSIPAFFESFLKAEGVWNPDQTIYESGKKSKPLVKTSSPADALPLTSFISEEWRDKLKIRLRAPEFWDVEQPLGNIQFGTLVHALLEKINTQRDVEPALHQAIVMGVIAREKIEPVRRMLDQVIFHAELGRYYSDAVKVKTEPEILLPDGKVARPDRVVFDNGHPVVIEYKTGKKDPRHIEQLNQYGDFLLEMGYDQVTKYLVYLHEKIEIEKI
ncbi:MAG: UvrD-helicase domain-containing protein [Bacteroidales bacterium]|nr:UvrD-helicase domain-containing protein [Bacteroidales bacterium]